MSDFCSGEAARVTRWMELKEAEDATVTGPALGLLNWNLVGCV